MSEFSDLLLNLVSEIKSQCSIDLFLSGGKEDIISARLQSTKHLYDTGRAVHPASSTTTAFPSLLVEGFDTEQVWQQLEVGCNSDLNLVNRRIEQIANNSNSFELSIDNQERQMKKEVSGKQKSNKKKTSKEIKLTDNAGFSKESDISTDDLSENDSIVKGKGNKNKKLNEKKRKLNDEVEQSDDAESENISDEDIDLIKALDNIKSSSEDEEPSKTKLRKQTKPMPVKPGRKKNYEVDDQFFKLEDMEAFVEALERKEDKTKSESESEEEDELSDDDSENEPMARDFFDAPDDEAADDDRQDDEEDQSSSDEEEKDFWKQTTRSKEEKSSFEKRMEKMKAKVNELEEENLGDKPWQMKGEIGASSRPQNSLLSELVDFEHVARQPPLITEEVTQTEESFIIQRIKDKAWDDVVRKVKPSDLGLEYRKKLVLNQEKSKVGLADLYAADYQKEADRIAATAAGQEVVEKEEASHKEIRQSLEKLFVKLDALSNFHFTPKPVMRDIEIVTNEPSISVENVAPTFISDSATLAPEEVQVKTAGQLVGADEKTSTDKKRERRRKKRRQRGKKREKEEREKLKNTLGIGGATSKAKAMEEVIKKSKMDKGITVLKGTKANEKKKMQNSNKSLSSSKFFSQLQQEAVDTIKQKSGHKQKETQTVSAKRIKL